MGSRRLGSQLSYPIDAATDSQGNLIVSDWGNYRVQKFFVNGTIVTLLTNIRVWKMYIDQLDDIYFMTSEDYVLQLTSTNRLGILAGDGYPGSRLDEFHQGLDVYVDQSGTFYVADFGNDRVMKWTVGASQGNATNQLDYPRCVYVDEINEIGALYICDYYNNRIQKWLPNVTQGIIIAGGVPPSPANYYSTNQANQLNFVQEIKFDS